MTTSSVTDRCKHHHHVLKMKFRSLRRTACRALLCLVFYTTYFPAAEAFITHDTLTSVCQDNPVITMSCASLWKQNLISSSDINVCDAQTPKVVAFALHNRNCNAIHFPASGLDLTLAAAEWDDTPGNHETVAEFRGFQGHPSLRTFAITGEMDGDKLPTISGNKGSRLFLVKHGASLTISYMELKDGRVPLRDDEMYVPIPDEKTCFLGGAAACVFNATFTIQHSSLKNHANTFSAGSDARGSGGAIFGRRSVLHVENCDFHLNMAIGGGAGICIHDGGACVVWCNLQFVESFVTFSFY